jgi:hypothetical protein
VGSRKRIALYLSRARRTPADGRQSGSYGVTEAAGFRINDWPSSIDTCRGAQVSAGSPSTQNSQSAGRRKDATDVPSQLMFDLTHLRCRQEVGLGLIAGQRSKEKFGAVGKY